MRGEIMSRKEITNFLSELLIKDKLSGAGKYYAKEVTLDYGKTEFVNGEIKSKTRRIDFLQFQPENQLSVSGIEKGIFICYEIKSCKADFLSGYGQNFVGEKNYLVMTIDTYKELKECGEIDKIPYNIGILVPMPFRKKYHEDKFDTEYDHPTVYPITEKVYLETIKPAKKKSREKSMTEMLFYMIRSGK